MGNVAMFRKWSAVKRCYGLQQPFNMEVAIPFLLNLFALAVMLVVCVILLFDGGLNIGTYRFYFLCYVSLMFLVAAVLGRAGIVSLAVFFWCVIELSMGLGSNALENWGLMQSLLPKNIFPQRPDPRFAYHPVLGIVPKPNTQGEWHIDRRNSAALAGIGWHVNPSFYEENHFIHNSFGLRGRELSAADLGKDLIFVYGGSTTYDYNVTQGATWVEQLEGSLKGRVTIVNFGVPAHGTTQHLIYTAFYQNILGKGPVCAVYYVGWNDLVNSHIKNLDPTYANYLYLLMVNRPPQLWLANYSPLILLIDRTARRRFDTVPEQPALPRQISERPSDDRLEQIFLEHIAAISAINNYRKIRTVYIGQMINRDLLESVPHGNDLSWFIENHDVWQVHKRLNSLLEGAAVSLGAKYIDAGIENFNNNDFVDAIHFSAAGSAKFARLISTRVGDSCQPTR